MMGIDGMYPESVEQRIRQERAETRAKAALISGPKKIFYDASLRIERIPELVRIFTNANSSYAPKARRVLINELSQLSSIAKRMPPDAASVIQSVIANTELYSKLDRKVGEAIQERGAVPIRGVFIRFDASANFDSYCDKARTKLELKALETESSTVINTKGKRYEFFEDLWFRLSH